jgi:ferredoxin
MFADAACRVIDPAGLDRLLALLRDEDGYELIGPTVRSQAIVYDRIAGVADLPRGVGDEQSPGRYRLRPRGDDALFGWATPAQSLKRELFAPRLDLVQIRRPAAGGAPEVQDRLAPAPRVALVAARPCDAAGIAVQDRVLSAGAVADADYAARRAGAFIIVANCGAPAGTCFCASLGTGPRARAGFDLALTELAAPRRFLVEAGSAAGTRLLLRLGAATASPEDVAAAAAVVESAAAHMGRELDTDGLAARLVANPEDARWTDIARRCLGCASCSLVCPTCFCTTFEETTDLAGEVATRTRIWDSCFTNDFAFVHGGSLRPSLRARYRQWLTHKLGTWLEQFGELGCVGCGRCITWCPAGIDITVEAPAIAGGS